MKHAANLLTGLRLLLAMALLVLSLPGAAFAVCYFCAGLSDVLDGPLARRLHTVSPFGAALDSLADAALCCVLLIRFLPLVAWPAWLLCCVAGIAAVRLASLLVGFLRWHTFLPRHTLLNKLTGLLLFCAPLAYFRLPLNWIAVPLCTVAALAAVEELLLQCLYPTPARDVWGIFFQKPRKS